MKMPKIKPEYVTPKTDIFQTLPQRCIAQSVGALAPGISEDTNTEFVDY